MPNYGGFDNLDRDLDSASRLAQSSYLRPDNDFKVSCQRNLMNSGAADQRDVETD